jgi:GntR family transcriptional repressor for pyruvate dehydrogenase complex
MAADIQAGGRGLKGDEKFHAAVTTAGHSGLLARLMGETADLIRDSRLESLGQPGRPSASLLGHQQIADAIRRQDVAGAASAMDAHIRLVSDVPLMRDVDDEPN